jgi:uncharacterized Zn finger protein (UPF0148 family)
MNGRRLSAKPCAACGAYPTVVDDHYSTMVMCPLCGSSVDREYRDDALEAWNRQQAENARKNIPTELP